MNTKETIYYIFDNTNYSKKLNKILNKESKELIIDLKELENKLYSNEFDNLTEFIIINTKGATNLIQSIIHDRYDTKRSLPNFEIRFKGIEKTLLKDLINKNLNKLVEITGTIKAITETKATPSEFMYTCTNCGRIQYKQAGEEEQENTRIYTNCVECGHEMKLDLNGTQYNNYKEIIIQEDKTKQTTKAPKTIRCIIEEEQEQLINKIDAGDKITLTGVLKVKTDTTGTIKPLYEYYINTNYIEKQDTNIIKLNKTDIEKIKEISKNKNILKLLTNSLAPNLIIDSKILLSILCYIVKGKTTENERNNIHILLITDPSMAKSKLANEILKLIEIGLEVDGTNTTGAGLTGAVIKDPKLNNWILEAGALTMANKGHLIIDEFDKLNYESSKNLLKGLEQNKIEIAKAGINETLETNTSLLALANPKYGRFDKYKPLTEQINIYPPLMSRMDLLFLLSDEADKNKDKAIIKAVTKKYKNKDKEQENNNILNTETLRKYLKYASCLNPFLSDEAEQEITNYYINTRNNLNDSEINFIDTRTGEAIIRIAGAIAKLFLSETITKEHIKKAIDLKEYSFKTAGYNPNTRQIEIEQVQGIPPQSDEKNRQYIKKLINEHIENKENLDKKSINKGLLKELVLNDSEMSKSTYYNTIKQLKQANELIEKNKRYYLK